MISEQIIINATIKEVKLDEYEEKIYKTGGLFKDSES
jgi:hypothetical protein